MVTVIPHARTVARYPDHRRKILRVIRELTPGMPFECSTTEIQATLQDSGLTLTARHIAILMGQYRRRGLVKSRLFSQRHLWTLTAEGKRFLEETAPPKKKKQKR